jgi:hypothetical protein
MRHATAASGSSSAEGLDTRAVFAMALIVGAGAAVVVALLDYTLAYNDARARLVVARRAFDSITPGIDQLGGIWLPLPHLLNLPLVQSDVLYRTGFGMVAINLAAFAGLAAATVMIVTALTGRRAAGLAAAALVVTHPDLLYLQATPMTEVLTLALLGGAIALLLTPGGARRNWMAGALLALAMLMRYEVWLAAASVLAVLAASAQHASRRAWHRHPAVPLAVLCLAALGAAAAWNRMMTGSWLVTAGFFPETDVAGRPWLAAGEVIRIAGHAAGPGLLILAAVGGVWQAWQAQRHPNRRILLLAAAPLTAAALYWSAAYAGHPVLNRFAVFLLLPVIWLGATGAAALEAAGRVRARAALLVLVCVWQAGIWIIPPVIREAAMDVSRRQPSAGVFDALERAEGEDRLLASMWTTASLLHGLSAYGIPLRRVVHEGNGTAWQRAMARPADHVEWILVACLPGDADRVVRGLASSPGASAPLAAFELAARSEELELYRRRPGRVARAEPTLCSGRTAALD